MFPQRKSEKSVCCDLAKSFTSRITEQYMLLLFLQISEQTADFAVFCAACLNCNNCFPLALNYSVPGRTLNYVKNT